MSKSYKLLGIESDAKTSKGTALGYLTAILYMAPANEAAGAWSQVTGKGVEFFPTLCSFATDECKEFCLFRSGMAQAFPSINVARVRKAVTFLTDREAFDIMLRADIRRFQSDAAQRNLIPCIRLNGTTDRPDLALAMAAEFPMVQFYDYTKLPSAWKRVRANYHLTFSFSGENLVECVRALEHGVNVAVVFDGGLPETWNGYQVINGDLSDLRFLDPKGVIVGLTPKGVAKKAPVGGFIQIGAAA